MLLIAKLGTVLRGGVMLCNADLNLGSRATGGITTSSLSNLGLRIAKSGAESSGMICSRTRHLSS